MLLAGYRSDVEHVKYVFLSGQIVISHTAFFIFRMCVCMVAYTYFFCIYMLYDAPEMKNNIKGTSQEAKRNVFLKSIVFTSQGP